MKLRFIKIQNAGNDYIYIDKKHLSRQKISRSILAKKICDRRRGVGADGIFIVDILAPNEALVEMRNSDGSSMEFCGNGVRGATLYMNENFKSRSRLYKISTVFNSYEISVLKRKDHSQTARLRIGNPSFESSAIGYSKKAKTCLGIKVKGNKKNWEAYCIAMPNPHAVIFVDNFDFQWQNAGKEIENNPLFTNRINVMFTMIKSKSGLSVMPWERGAGPTLSCGSGGAGAAIISHLLGYTFKKVSVQMPGGVLKTEWDISENAVYQEGPSEIVCSGIFRY